jgi:beta-ketodecanoyl-[acyl-carrier-protein] synthase
VLDPDIMQPPLPERPDDQPSIMVEMAVAAAEQALIAAGREPARSILSSSPPPTCRWRPYPALAIELQHYLGRAAWRST